MLDLSDLDDYQLRAINHQIEQPKNFVWLFMGAGKTVITLTTIAHLIKHGAMRAALVCAPLRVAQSGWASEARKWAHLRHLRFSLVHGTPEQRLRALSRPADVYLINYEGLVWLASQLIHYYIRRGTLLPFDMLVLDESPKMKTPGTKRMAAMSGDPKESIPSILPYFNYRTGLTGTPATNGYEDLFGQFLVIDNGQRLGVSHSAFISNYFAPADANGYKYRVTPEGKHYIQRAISDIVLEMKESDYITLPDLIVNDIYVDLKPQHRRQYDQLEMQLFTELDNGVELEVNGEAGKSNKCRQFANGATYTNTETKEWHKVHDEKLDALEEILDEAGGSPVLLAYNYRPDAYRIMERFPFAVNLTGLSGSKFNQALDDWKRGELRLVLGHPASMGHGVDGLQHAGNILVWFGPPWSLDQYLQFNARLRRRGQGEPVRCHRILTRDTLDDAVVDSLEVKEGEQQELRAAVDRYRQHRGL